MTIQFYINMIGRLKLPFNRSWLTCPLAMNMLLSQIECVAAEKWLEITTQLKDVQGLNFHGRIFVSPDSTLVSQYERTVVDFSQCNGQTIISDWLSKYDFKNTNVCKYLPRTTDYALVDIAELQMPWFKSKGSNPVMTVYNSYSYTEDIKYEARLLKFPLDYRNFKLVILLPNEKGTDFGLFQRLIESGVNSALQFVQPLFTVLSDLKSPNINFYEENDFLLEKREKEQWQGLSIGRVNINDEGVLLKCLTCIHSQGTCQPDTQSCASLAHTKIFLFTIMYNDCAMFTGQSLKKIDTKYLSRGEIRHLSGPTKVLIYLNSCVKYVVIKKKQNIF